jgi:hypothetical protein
MEYNRRGSDLEHNRRRRRCPNLRNLLSAKTIFVIGIAFGLIGPSLWVFTGLNIMAREQALSGANLSVEETWQIEGSLHWWRDLNTRFSCPLATVLFIGGLITILTTRPKAPEEIE